MLFYSGCEFFRVRVLCTYFWRNYKFKFFVVCGARKLAYLYAA